MTKARYDICAAVVSDLQYDARVWKEVRSLAAAGYKISLLGCAYGIKSTRRSQVDGIDVVEIPLGERSRRIGQLERARTLVRLWREVLATSARVYHTHNVHPAPAAWLAARLRRASIIYDAHELYGDWGGRSLSSRLVSSASWLIERIMVRAADRVFTTNQSRADELLRRHGRRDIGLLANVPNRVGQLRPIDPGFVGSQVVLYQGGIYAQRSFRETLQALALLPEVELAILGFGHQREIDQIRRWADEVGVSHRVRFYPPRPFTELVHTAAYATVGIVPIRPNNLNNFTGDTNKLHEYLMAGLPVIASNLPEIARVVTAGRPAVGELFDPYSPKSIADAFHRVTDDPNTYALRRREARRVALEQFNWQMEEPHLLNAYSSLVGDRDRTVVQSERHN